MTDWHIPELKQSLKELREYEDNMTLPFPNIEPTEENLKRYGEAMKKFDKTIFERFDELVKEKGVYIFDQTLKFFLRDELTTLAKELKGKSTDSANLFTEAVSLEEVIAAFKKYGIEL